MSQEVVGVPVSQSHRDSDAVVGIPVTQGRDEFDDGYQGSPNYRPVRDSRSEEPSGGRGRSQSAYGNNSSFGEASPGGGYTYTGAASPGTNGAQRTGGGGGKKVVKISAEEVQNWKDAFHVSQEAVIQALREAKGDRNKTVELLQLGPNRPRNVSAGDNQHIEVRRNVIRISQQEITGFARMFNATEEKVIQVMREVKGDRDKAIARLFNGAGLPSHAPAGFGTANYYPAPAGASSSSSQGPTMSMVEADQLAAVFGVADRKEEVAEIVNLYGSNRDTVMSKLETLASQPPKQPGFGGCSGAGGGSDALPAGTSLGKGSNNAWDPSPVNARGAVSNTNEAVNHDDIEIMTDDFLGSGGTNELTSSGAQNTPAGPAGRSAADIDGPPPAGASFGGAAPSRGTLPNAPGSSSTTNNRGVTDDPGYMAGGRTEQMLPPAPGSW